MQNGKGDKRRPGNRKAIDANWQRVFGGTCSRCKLKLACGPWNWRQGGCDLYAPESGAGDRGDTGTRGDG